MNVIELNKFRRNVDSTLIVFADLQIEYISEGRAYYLEGAAGCLENCRRLLSQARDLQLPIAHFRRLTRTQFFNRETKFSHWIPDFKPRPSEMVFERETFSCYANDSFREFLNEVRNPVIIMAGLTGEHSCLATAVDAARRGHHLIYVSDASFSSALGNFSPQDSHELTTHIINGFAQIARTSEVLSFVHRPRPQASTALL